METLATAPLRTESELFDSYLRAQNDSTTWLAETLDGSMRTPFTYRFNGREIIAEDGDKIARILQASIDEAEEMAALNPSLKFELRRRHIEYEEHNDLCDMARGERPNTMVVISDFPPELMEATQDVGGYNVTRKQTMLRVFTWDGEQMQMITQTLDRSDRDGLEAIYTACGRQAKPGELLGQRIYLDLPEGEQDFVADRLTGVYDRTLQNRYGGEWYAGRRELRHDTYKFVCGQQDLIDRFMMTQLEGDGGERERYNIAALLAKRYEASKYHAIHEYEHASKTIWPANLIFGAMEQNLDMQLRLAGNQARAARRTFSGCGASVSGGSGNVSATEQLSSAGYGNKAEKDEDEYGSLSFKCPKGHSNRRPRGKLIERCQVCHTSVRC